MTKETNCSCNCGNTCSCGSSCTCAHCKTENSQTCSCNK